MSVCKKKKLPLLLMLIAMLNIFVACGSGDDDDDSAQNEQQPEEQTDAGIYQAPLTALNISVGGNPTGTATIEISGDAVEADVVLRNAQSTVHAQFIYTGTRCPVAQDDINADGFIDYQEAKVAAGQILIPLDNELSSQAAGGAFPTGSFYSYDELTSLTQMLADLTAPDPNPADDIAKLPPASGLNLAGRVVVIHGVRESVDLPATVAGAGTVSPEKVLPIACGKFVRVAEGEPIPVPVPVPTPTPPTPAPNCPGLSDFSTRLSNTLLISGERCRGGERTETPNPDGSSRFHICKRGQWLITVDNENVCNPDGSCTEIFVFPIISRLARAGESNPPGQCTYNMIPLSPATPEDIRDMRSHQVRFYDDRDPQVIPR